MFVFSPGSCGYFCLKYILKKKIKKEVYMNMYGIKEMLNKFDYYCIGMRVKSLHDIKKECITLIKSGKKSYHYVVIKEILDKFVVFYDPLFVNLRKKKIAKFTKKWNKVCLFYTKV